MHPGNKREHALIIVEETSEGGLAMGLAAKKIEKSHSSKLEVKSFSHPDTVREFPKGKVELIDVGGCLVGRARLEPGWRWSTSVQPLAKTKSCEAPHFQYHVSGRLMVVMDDGTQRECGPGDVSRLGAGHDAWVLGNEPVVLVDFQGMAEFAKTTAPGTSAR